jgi:selenocysteine-specific elongation factor
MKSVIVGTAGHIDHGKTALVKALTGIDADRLEEEKRRGITIDIGFAHLELPAPSDETLRLGFVDVPGHERFVRNMLAGIGGIDLVLLVIAADESIKPQTREHFDICKLLSVQRGITVLTKSDLVDEETLEVMRLEVQDFVRDSFLDASRSPIIPVSSLTGVGINELKAALVKASSQVSAKQSAALTRLPIDRVFSMKGFGTVVTGTLVAGTIRKEDELEIFPCGEKVRVRGVQVHGEVAERALAGERTALNLAAISREDLGRGTMLAAPDTFRSTKRIDVSLSLLGSSKPLKDRARVHLHAYTFESVAEVVLNAKQSLTSGETGFAQLRLAEPTLMLPGDRFIIRQFSPLSTIGGGIVLDAAPLPRKSNYDIASFLHVMATGSPEQVLAARIARRAKQGFTMREAVAETGWPTSRLEPAIKAAQNEIVWRTERMVSTAVFNAMLSEAVTLVNAFQKANPLQPGISREVLREQLNAHPEIFSLVVDALLRAKKLEMVGDQLRLAGTGVVMKDEEAESKEIIEHAFASAGLKVPALKDVLAGLKVDRIRAQKIVTLLLRDKTLIKTSEDLVFHHSALDDLRKKIAAERSKSSKLDIARFKDLTGVSRKYAIPLLEYLDREHVTRRVGDDRLII